MCKKLTHSPAEHIDTQNDTQLNEVTRECLKSLAFEGMDFRANEIEEAARNTCNWLADHVEYNKWLSADCGVLWIKGNPGSGKSTLLRHALDNRSKLNILKGRGPFIISFFFHGRGTQLQKTRMGFLRSVLHQILSRHKSLSRQHDALCDLVTTYQDWRDSKRTGNQEMEWQENQLARYLRRSIRSASRNCPVLLYVDALDEAGKENAVALAAEFSTLIDDAKEEENKLHICFTCRHYPILGESYPFEICLDNENKGDISTYVHNRLSSDDFPPSILRLIIDGAKGVFMWARLVMDKALQLHREGHNEETIEQHVRSIPSELDDIYMKIIEDMKGNDDSLKLVQWICFSVHPLSLDDMRWAMVMDDDSSHTTLQQHENTPGYIRSNEQMKKRLKALSCGLAETVGRIDKSNIQFIHQSVTDFFLTKGLLILEENLGRGEPKPSVRSVAGMANFRLARSCVQFLCLTDATGYLREGKLPHFFHYALLWRRHLKDIQTKDVASEMVFKLLPASESINWEMLEIQPYSAEDESSLLRVLEISVSKQQNRKKYDTWIHLATRFSFAGLLSVMLQTEEGIRDVDVRYRWGETPLMYAARENGDIFKIIFGTAKVNLTARDNSGRTALTKAAQAGNDGAVELLIAAPNVDIESRDNEGKTPFLHAATNGRESVVRMLLDTGNVNSEVRDKSGKTPFFYAARYGHESVARILLDTGKVDIEVRDESRKTPFLHAAEAGNESVVRMLLDTGNVDIEVEDIHGRTPFSVAAKNGRDSVVKLLLNTSNVDIEARDKKGKTPFLHAAKNGRESVVKLLLKTGNVDIEARDENGKTPFLHAAEMNGAGMLELLIGTGVVDLQARDNENNTALLLSISSDKAKWPLDTSMFYKDAREWQTARRLVAEHRKASTVRFLLESGKESVNEKDNNGMTPLSVACSRGELKVVELLLGTGKAEIEARDKNHRTPLIHAARAGSEAVTKRLLEGKADIYAMDKEGYTATYHATEGNHTDVIRLLRTKAEAKRMQAIWLAGQYSRE